ncbi:MAG TPA: hypothetical protein VF712_03440 [Thermoleophilaceae bacterium]|jgi:hypothetical protein
MPPNVEPPTRPPSLDALKFERRPMVRWLDPAVLADAALRVVLSSVFGSYADKREIQRLMEEPPHDYSGAGDPFWLDFVADLGDGFDSTYAMACILARPELQVGGETLPRGRALVMGGDEVYPTASREEYEARFRGPYEAAFPWTDPEQAPDLYAIPGNHDWYDGLTNFGRFFCSERWIGGWRTRQRRSYFGLRLPHNWWLLAIDIQLDTYIDDAQLDYFRGLGMQPGDRAILVTGKPSWTKVEAGEPLERQPDSYKNLQYFKDQAIPEGVAVPVTLTGDLHHYCRYHADDGSHLITSGGGGAYLFPTHTQHETLEIPAKDGGATAYRCDQSLFPSREESKGLVWGALALTRHAPRLLWIFSVLYALFGLSLYWVLQDKKSWLVGTIAVGLLLWLGLSVYAAKEKALAKIALGTAHTIPHLVLAAIPAYVLAECLDLDGWGWALAATAVAALFGFLLAGVVFGAYLIASHRKAPKHANEVLACQGIADYKNFLRLRIDASGLRIYAIGVRKVPRRWEADPGNADPSAPWLKPVDRQLEVELIDDGPIDVAAGG